MKKILLKGPVLTQSGYGHHTRTVLRALKTRKDIFDIYIQPIAWGHTSWIWEDDEERRYIESLVRKTGAHVSQNGTFDISLQVSIPNEWEKLAPINIGITAGIETTKVAPRWIEKSYLMDKIITISEHSKRSYEETICGVINQQTGEKNHVKAKGPIEYVSYPVRTFEPAELDLNLETEFNFLAVAQLSPRKNTDQLIRCFVEKFKDNEEVGLIIKANLAKNSLIDRKHTYEGLKRLISEYKDRKCKIYLLHGFLNDNEMAALYTHPKIKALYSTTHGEGFGLPIFEAAYYGLPVIATDWSGHLDFLYKPGKKKDKKKHMFARISYTLGPIQPQAVWEEILEKDSMWAYPEEGSIKMNLEEVYKDYGRFKKRSKELQKWVCKEFSEEKKYAEYVDSILQLLPDALEQFDVENWLEETEEQIKIQD